MRSSMLLKALRLCRKGAGSVEFALVAPIMVMFIIGGIYLSLLGFTAASLAYSVEAGARCASVNTTICTSTATTATFAQGQFMNLSGGTPTFAANSATCGNRVTGSVTFVINTGVSKVSVPLSASSCFPFG